MNAAAQTYMNWIIACAVCVNRVNKYRNGPKSYIALDGVYPVVEVFCEAGGGSPDEARLEQTPYPFQPH